ncbi:unnamed protein product [Dicrocoelium dendriticum]|nr:unnamed protein product [Dicrocoelium dendriticum]CAH8670190.1 unnamed protein product [Dicrocoelium dendriticum]
MKDTGPGPADYTITSVWGGRKPGPCGLMIPESLIRMLDEADTIVQQRQICNKVYLVRSRSAPSIPSGRFVHGYTEGPGGRLRLQKGPSRDTTLGPAYYGKLGNPKFTRYGGCGWSKRTAKRQPLHKADHKVGPNEYDPYPDPWERIVTTARERESIRPTRPLLVPRLLDKVVQETEKWHFPGPGAYTLPDMLLKKVERWGPNGLPIPTAPFNVEAQRFKENVNDVPAPNAYYPPKNTAAPTGKVPFNSSDARFKSKGDPGPAPNSYNPPRGFVAELIKKNTTGFFADYVVPFGSTTKRFVYSRLPTQSSDNEILSSSDMEGTPGPAHYQPEKHHGVGTDEKKVRITIQNRHQQHSLLSDAPPPGTYNVAESYDRTQSKCQHRALPNLDRKPCQAAFLVSSRRFDKSSCLSASDPSMPGPADYEISSALNEKSGKFVYQAGRFRSKEQDATPGPADYKLAPTIESCLRLGTFNVTLKKNYTIR